MGRINSRNKGKHGELEIVHILNDHGYSEARRGNASIGESDIEKGPPGYHLEVKRREQERTEEWMRQSERDAKAGEIPVVLFRKNKEEWKVCMRLAEFLQLIGGGNDMAIYRAVQMAFWTDATVSDEYTADDRLIYLYFLTNPHTNLAGCYQITIRQISTEVGYDAKKVKKLIERASKEFNTIKYNYDTKELLVVNWSKYNWTDSAKFRKPLLEQIQEVKDTEFKAYLMDIYNGIDTVSIPYAYGMDTTDAVTVTVTDTVTDTVSVTEDTIDNPYKQVIENLNELAGRSYAWDSTKGKKNREYIDARMKEGYTVEDFLKINALKCKEWGTDPFMKKYLRPETLYSRKHFESYLNEPEMGGDYF